MGRKNATRMPHECSERAILEAVGVFDSKHLLAIQSNNTTHPLALHTVVFHSWNIWLIPFLFFFSFSLLLSHLIFHLFIFPFFLSFCPFLVSFIF